MQSSVSLQVPLLREGNGPALDSNHTVDDAGLSKDIGSLQALVLAVDLDVQAGILHRRGADARLLDVEGRAVAGLAIHVCDGDLRRQRTGGGGGVGGDDDGRCKPARDRPFEAGAADGAPGDDLDSALAALDQGDRADLTANGKGYGAEVLGCRALGRAGGCGLG